MSKTNYKFVLLRLLSLIGIFAYITMPAQALAVSSSTATLIGTAPVTSAIVTGIDTSNNSDVTVDGSSDTVAPTTPTWVTSNPDVGPLSYQSGLYNLEATPPCSTATATSINLVMQGIRLQLNGNNVDTDANAGATMWLVNPADGSTGIPSINSGIQYGSWVSGSTIVSNGVSRGFNSDPMASSVPLVGEFNAEYPITSSPGEVIDFQVLVEQGMKGGFVTATDIETSTPVGTVTWDDSSCPVDSGNTSTNAGSSTPSASSSTAATTNNTASLAETGDNLTLVSAIGLSVSALGLVIYRRFALKQGIF